MWKILAGRMIVRSFVVLRLCGSGSYAYFICYIFSYFHCKGSVIFLLCYGLLKINRVSLYKPCYSCIILNLLQYNTFILSVI